LVWKLLPSVRRILRRKIASLRTDLGSQSWCIIGREGVGRMDLRLIMIT